MMYGENLNDDRTWWQRHKETVYVMIISLSVLLAVGGMIIICTDNPHAQLVQPEGPGKFDQVLTEEFANAKCGEYNMEWYQYTDASMVYKDRKPYEEAVLYCFDRETKVTIRDMIPLVFEKDGKK